MEIEFHPLASEELAASVLWYDAQSDGLGQEFLNAIMEAARQAAAAPKLWPEREGARCLLVSRFPYSLRYIERNGKLLIVSVAHHKRAPGFWKGRA